jgi:Uncharacterised protein conserved in bacteria (DUF2336)
VKSPAIPNLEGLDRLAFREGVDIRPTLVRVLTDLYVQKPAHTTEEEHHYTELVLQLIDAVDVPTRAIVARKLATYEGAPTAVVRRLARDVFEVAEPVLRHSSRIGGADLLDVIQDFGPRYAAVIATRCPPEPIRNQAAASGPADPGCSAPTGAERSRNVSPTDAEDFDGVDTPIEAVEMPPGLRLGELFFAASSAERRAILTNLDRDDVDPPAPPEAEQPNEAFGRLENAALQCRRPAFIGELASALGVDPGLAQRIVEDAAGEPMLVAVKAMGMPSEILLRILLFLDPAVGQSVPRVFDLARFYDRLTRKAASHVVASLRGTATMMRRAQAHQPVLWNDEADRGRRAAMEAARRPAGALPPVRREVPARRQGTT